MRILILAGFVLFVLSVTIPFTSLASQHACASPIPPPVVGTPVQPSPISGDLFINEVLLTPHSTWNCSEFGTYTSTNDAWVEIYNSQNVAYDLSSAFTSLDSGPNTNGFYFPSGSVIAAHSFLVVFPRVQATFFSTETSQLRLLISGISVDEVTLPSLDLPADTSYARSPDGSNTWQLISAPSIDTSNPSLQITAAPSMAATVSRTPTPTASPRPSATPHSSRKRSASGTSKQDTSGPATNGQTTDTTQTSDNSFVLVDGAQPTWNKMSMPASTSASSRPSQGITKALPTQQLQAPPNSNDTSNTNTTLRKAGITLVAILLAGCLFWCWTIFRPSDQQKQKEQEADLHEML